jgi:hypothetical protein
MSAPVVSWRATVLVAGSIVALGCDRTREADPLEYLFRAPRGRFIQISSYDTTGGNRDRLEIATGDSSVLVDEAGPGVITRIWITVSSSDPHYLRRIALKMYWNGEEVPSVSVPLGDFFGNGFDKHHFTSSVLGVSSGGFYSYLPMPFRSRARIVVENGTGKEIDAFYYQVGIVQTDGMPRDMPTLHAWWNRDIRTDRAEPHLVLDARGSGRFVGMSLNAESYEGSLDFLEGDESFVVDGGFRGQGTGTEDYFNAGWYFDRGPFHAPFHGLILKDESLGRIAAYRWHVPDPIDFRDSIRMTLEHGHANQAVADYATVAYWYQSEPHQPLPALQSPDLRRVLGVKIPPGAVLERDLDVRREGLSNTIVVQVPRPDRYEVLLYPLAGPGLGTVSYRLHNGAVCSLSLVADDPGTVLEPVNLGDVALETAVEVLVVAPTEDAVVPAAVLARPVAQWATEWNVVGPFPNPRLLATEISPAVDSAYAPEENPSLTTTYLTEKGKRISWRRVMASPDGQVRLNPHFMPNDWVAAYAQAFLFAPEDRSATLMLGADDAHVMWVNGERVSERQGRNISRADDLAVDVALRAGWNRVLLKVADLDGGWAFQVRAADPHRVLRWSARPVSSR